MKIKITILVFLLAHFCLTGQEPSDEQTGLPGDQFSLEAALDLCKKSSSPEEFEKLLNAQDNQVTNLDLDEDGNTDYVKVVTAQDGDVHLFILQVAVNETENQDIAVIELEKTGTDEATLQIVGDEEIFGEEIILEPSDGSNEEDNIEKQAHKKSKGGPSAPSIDDNTTYIIVNVWSWPCVRHVYAPSYRPWVSPYRWRVYPTWYRPWRPLVWNVWHPIRVRHHHHGPVRVVHVHRIPRAHTMYKPMHVTSRIVKVKHTAAHDRYKVTRTKTKVTDPAGNTRTKTSTKVSNRKGNVKAEKTTVRRGKKGG
jgi:hypothetical protein